MFHPARVRVLASTLSLALLPAQSSAQYRRAPTLDDMLDLVQVSSPQISPDGRRVLFTRTEIKNWTDNRRVSTIWIADADGRSAYQFLGSDRDRSPRWSPDGSLVAFLSSRDGGEASRDQDSGGQIWLIRAEGGEAWRLTTHAGTIRSFEWMPDSTRIVFVSADAKTDDQKAAEKAGDDAIYVDEGPNGQTSGSYSSLWIVSIADRTQRRLTRDRVVVDDFEPSPDGRRVAFTYRRDNSRNGQYRSEIAVVDIETGRQMDLTANEAPEGDLRWSPDGTRISFTAPDERTWELAEDKVWVVPATGGSPQRISGAFAGAIRQYVWTLDGRAILFTGTRRGRGGLFRLDVATGSLDTLAAGDWTVTLDSVTADRRRGATVVSRFDAPADIYLADLSTGVLTRITEVNPQLRQLELATVRWIRWASRDGLEVEGLLWLPATQRGGPLPLLVSVHGGPAGVWSASFRGLNHVYAGLGWAILEPNVRGSSTYGDAWLRGNLRDIGGGDFDDLVSGVDALVAQGVADPDQLAIRGWSYGGILGGWTLTRTARFRAASLGAIVTDWSSEYAMGFNHDVRRWYIGGTPWDNPDGYRERSSYTHIAKVTTPTILFHGERDTTDTIGQSMMFYQALTDRGVPVRFLRFPREPHGFREPHHVRLRDAEEIAWLMKHARGLDWTAPPRPAPAKATPDRPVR